MFVVTLLQLDIQWLESVNDVWRYVCVYVCVCAEKVVLFCYSRIIQGTHTAAVAAVTAAAAGALLREEEWNKNKQTKTLKKTKKKMAVSTLRGSQAVTDPSTNRALPRLTSEFGWDLVFSW